MSARYRDEGSTGKAPRQLRIAVRTAIVLLAVVVILYLCTAPTDKKDRWATLLEESLKASLTFAFIVLGGTLIKRVADADLEDRRAAREAAEQSMERLHADRRAAEDRRRKVLDELAAVF